MVPFEETKKAEERKKERKKEKMRDESTSNSRD